MKNQVKIINWCQKAAIYTFLMAGFMPLLGMKVANGQELKEPTPQEQFYNPDASFYVAMFNREYEAAIAHEAKELLIHVQRDVARECKEGFEEFFKRAVEQDDAVTVIGYNPLGRKQMFLEARFFDEHTCVTDAIIKPVMFSRNTAKRQNSSIVRQRALTGSNQKQRGVSGIMDGLASVPESTRGAMQDDSSGGASGSVHNFSEGNGELAHLTESSNHERCNAASLPTSIEEDVVAALQPDENDKSDGEALEVEMPANMFSVVHSTEGLEPQVAPGKSSSEDAESDTQPSLSAPSHDEKLQRYLALVEKFDAQKEPGAPRLTNDERYEMLSYKFDFQQTKPDASRLTSAERVDMLWYKRNAKTITLEEFIELTMLRQHKPRLVSTLVRDYWRDIVHKVAARHGNALVYNYEQAKYFDSIARRRLAGIYDYYEALDFIYTDNFGSEVKLERANIAGITKENAKLYIYEFFGYKKENRATIKLEDVQAVYYQKLASAVTAKDDDLEFLLRQCEIAFRNEISKKEYDFYLTLSELFAQFTTTSYKDLNAFYTTLFEKPELGLDAAVACSAYEYFGIAKADRAKKSLPEIRLAIVEKMTKADAAQDEQTIATIRVFEQLFLDEQARGLYDFYLEVQDIFNKFSARGFDPMTLPDLIEMKTDKLDPLLTTKAYHACYKILKKYSAKFEEQRKNYLHAYDKQLGNKEEKTAKRFEKAAKKLLAQQEKYREAEEHFRKMNEAAEQVEQAAELWVTQGKVMPLNEVAKGI